MKKTHNPVAKEREKDDVLYKCPEVTIFNEKQWLYIKRRYMLTERELEVSMLICRGFSNKEIARNLHIEEGTVKIHIGNVYRKVRVKNKISLLLMFLEDINKILTESD